MLEALKILNELENNIYSSEYHILIENDINYMDLTEVFLYKKIIEKCKVPLYIYQKKYHYKFKKFNIDVKDFYQLLKCREKELVNKQEECNNIIKKLSLKKEEFYKNNLIRKEYPYLTTLTYMLSLATENYIPIKFNIYESKEIDNNIKNIIKNVYKKKGWIIEYNIKLKKEMEYNNFPYGFELYDLYSKLETKYKSTHNMLFELTYFIEEVLKNKRLIS